MSVELNLEGVLCIQPELSQEDARDFEAHKFPSWGLINNETIYPKEITQDPLKELGFLMSGFLASRDYSIRGELSWRTENGRTGFVQVATNEIRMFADVEADPADLTVELMSGLQDIDRERRLLAIDMIDQEYQKLTNKAVFIPHLLELSENRDLDIRLAAVTALGRFKEYSRQILPTLMLAMTDPNPWIRAAAAENLGDFGKAAQVALPALQDLTRDRNDGPSFQAQGAIHRILAAPAACS